MTKAEICDLFDRKPDLTLQGLSRITGLPVATLKRILMESK